MAEQMFDMFRSGMFAPRSGKKQTEMASSYDDDDPRLRLSSAQWVALRPVIRGDSIAAISTQSRTSPNRVRRWLKSPIFRRAVAAEIANPTDARFHRSILLQGVQEANALRRERAAAKELEAEDEQV